MNLDLCDPLKVFLGIFEDTRGGGRSGAQSGGTCIAGGWSSSFEACKFVWLPVTKIFELEVSNTT